MQIVVYC